MENPVHPNNPTEKPRRKKSPPKKSVAKRGRSLYTQFEDQIHHQVFRPMVGSILKQGVGSFSEFTKAFNRAFDCKLSEKSARDLVKKCGFVFKQTMVVEGLPSSPMRPRGVELTLPSAQTANGDFNLPTTQTRGEDDPGPLDNKPTNAHRFFSDSESGVPDRMNPPASLDELQAIITGKSKGLS
jgi:hypothetical protein